LSIESKMHSRNVISPVLSNPRILLSMKYGLKFLRSASTIIGCVTLVGACHPKAPVQSAEASSTSSYGVRPHPDSITTLIKSLRRVGVHFDPPTPVNFAEFVGDHSDFHRFEEFRESAALRLADCIDNTLPTSTTYRGKAVALGYMCYTALRHLIYYEPPYDETSGASQWKGFLNEPNANQNAARQAKAAWLSVIRADLYHFLY